MQSQMVLARCHIHTHPPKEESQARRTRAIPRASRLIHDLQCSPVGGTPDSLILHCSPVGDPAYASCSMPHCALLQLFFSTFPIMNASLKAFSNGDLGNDWLSASALYECIRAVCALSNCSGQGMGLGSPLAHAWPWFSGAPRGAQLKVPLAACLSPSLPSPDFSPRTMKVIPDQAFHFSLFPAGLLFVC